MERENFAALRLSRVLRSSARTRFANRIIPRGVLPTRDMGCMRYFLAGLA
jgi:hypothetical protein